jgi:hypothetical protein
MRARTCTEKADGELRQDLNGGAGATARAAGLACSRVAIRRRLTVEGATHASLADVLHLCAGDERLTLQAHSVDVHTHTHTHTHTQKHIPTVAKALQICGLVAGEPVARAALEGQPHNAARILPQRRVTTLAMPADEFRGHSTKKEGTERLATATGDTDQSKANKGTHASSGFRPRPPHTGQMSLRRGRRPPGRAAAGASQDKSFQCASMDASMYGKK